MSKLKVALEHFLGNQVPRMLADKDMPIKHKETLLGFMGELSGVGDPHDPTNITIQLTQSKEKDDPVKEPLPCNFEIKIIGEDAEILQALAGAIQRVVAEPSLDVIPINNAKRQYSKKYIRESLAKKNGIVITTKYRTALKWLDKM